MNNGIGKVRKKRKEIKKKVLMTAQNINIKETLETKNVIN